jgi:hypothetical protein
VTKRSRYERERHDADTTRLKEIETAWLGSVAAEKRKAFAEAVAAAKARGPAQKPPDMAPGTAPNPPRPGHEPKPPKADRSTRRRRW